MDFLTLGWRLRGYIAAGTMQDLAGAAAMALSGLSALISTSSAEPATSSASSDESALSVLASINYNPISAQPTPLTPGKERNSTLSSSATFSAESQSSAGIPDSMDDNGDVEDDIAGLLQLTQVAAHMRPPKRIAPERPQKVPSIRLKAKKEQKVKVKAAPVTKAKPSKHLKPVKSPKSKPSSARRPMESNHSARAVEKEKPFEMEVSADSDGEGGPQIEVEEFQNMFESISKEAELATRDLRKSKSGSVEVYGEVLPAFVESLRDALALNSSDVFFDLGSGIGNVVCQIACQVGCRCYGVEIRSDLHAIAEAAYERVRKEMSIRGYRMGSVQLTNADALTQQVLLVDTTVVFLNNMGFPESMQGPLEHFFTECLPHGSRLVTLRELFPRLGPSNLENKRMSRSFATLFKHPCETFVAEPGAVSWTNEPVPVYIYTVDREAWSAVTFAINRPNNMMSSSLDSLRASSNSMARAEKSSPKPKKSGLNASSPGLPTAPSSTQAQNNSNNDSLHLNGANDANTDSSNLDPSHSAHPANHHDLIAVLAQNAALFKGSPISPQAQLSLAGNNPLFLRALQRYESTYLPIVSCPESPLQAFARTGQLHLPRKYDSSFVSAPASFSSALSNQEVFGQIEIGIDFAFECLKSNSSRREEYEDEFCTSAFRRSSARSMVLSQLIGSDLANPLVSLDSLTAKLSDHYSRSSSKEGSNWHTFDGLFSHSRNLDANISDIDRDQRADLKRVRSERAAKLAEISLIAVEAHALDGEWQRDWLEVERVRLELAEMEEKLEALAKKRHAAVHQLTNLLEDETDESLANLDLQLPESTPQDDQNANQSTEGDEGSEHVSKDEDTPNRTSIAASSESVVPTILSEKNGAEMDISEPAAVEETAGDEENGSTNSVEDSPLPTARLGPCTQLRSFLEDGKRFMEENGIEMPVMKKAAKSKLDKRFGMKAKKSAVKPSPRNVIPATETPSEVNGAEEVSSRLSVDSRPSTSSKDSSSAMQVDETEAQVNQLISGADHGRGERPRGSRHSERLSASSSAIAAAALERHQPAPTPSSSSSSTTNTHVKKADAERSTNGSELVFRFPNEHFLRFSRPKRVATLAAPANEPSKRVKRPGQKSLDRKQLKAALTSALTESSDGKLSIVELRQSCKDLPPFKDLREKQIERKVWDALSKAQDQFKHALPTPAERKAHAMGAGKAGLWSINPKWRRTASFSAMEASGHLSFAGAGALASSATSATDLGASTGSLDYDSEAALAAANALSAAAEEFEEEDEEDLDFDEEDEEESDDLDGEEDEEIDPDMFNAEEALQDAEEDEEDGDRQESDAEIEMAMEDSNTRDSITNALEKEDPNGEAIMSPNGDDKVSENVVELPKSNEGVHDGLTSAEPSHAELISKTSAISENAASERGNEPNNSELPTASVIPQEHLSEPRTASSDMQHDEQEDYVVEEEMVEAEPHQTSDFSAASSIAPPSDSTLPSAPSATSNTNLASIDPAPSDVIDASDSHPNATNSRKRTRLDLETYENAHHTHENTGTSMPILLEAAVASEDVPPAKRFSPPPSDPTSVTPLTGLAEEAEHLKNEVKPSEVTDVVQETPHPLPSETNPPQ